MLLEHVLDLLSAQRQRHQLVAERLAGEQIGVGHRTFTLARDVGAHAAGEAKAHGAALPEHGGSEASGEAEHSKHPLASVPRKDIKHFSNFTPKWHNYYAIYFTLTGLHGLHVLAGALVLTYMLFFGRKLYLQDPEHMANRVEVGGLFWHFVDLVWIFLFPLLYLV